MQTTTEAARLLLTRDEVAELLRVTPRWVERARTDGRIPCIRIGRHVRFDAEVVERLAREGVPEVA